ncbi:MAG: cobalamin biosynthesis protein CobD, partial [Comamonas sp.]|nr:cobalamin biosynthesis protein CobD [Candidatus Comamonas equi]
MAVVDVLLGLSPAAWLWQWASTEGAAQQGWATLVMTAALAVLVALLIDKLWGEPPTWLHPVVGMGKLLDKLGKCIAPSRDNASRCKTFVAGSIAWCGLVALFFAIYAALQWWLPAIVWWVDGLVLGVLLKPLLSWRMLQSEVLAVEAALQTSLPAGRERLSWLVSRDTTQLDAGTVRESAIETLAENLSDSVIAPLFWFALLGLPGAAAYRLANTADAMWGYPGWRGQGSQRRYWQWAGKWAARADDVLNWLPARLTGWVLAMVGRGVTWAALRRDAAVTPSPNGGWPMGAMAQALKIRLGKPGVYVLNPSGQVPQ